MGFWESVSRATIARAPLRTGHHVLDVCCGGGGATIPAGQAVGPNGRVLGIDLASALLDLARAKAARAKLAQVEFVEGDFAELREPGESFDGVVCALGAYEQPEPKAGLQRLWRWVRPGGNLAFATWGARPLEPLAEIFRRHVGARRDDFKPTAGSWDALATPAAVQALFRSAGIAAVVVEATAGEQRLSTAADAWTLLMGSWHRGTIEALTIAERAQVRDAVLAEVDARHIGRVEVNVIHVLARKVSVAGGMGPRRR